MKKAFLLLALLLLAAWLSGCAQSVQQRPSKDSPVTVEVWNYYNGEQKRAFDSLVEQFNEEEGREQGITVRSVSKLDTDTLIADITAAADGEPGTGGLPNAVFVYSDMAYYLAEKELLADFDQYLEEEQLAGYVTGFLEEGRILEDGKVYILPVAKSTELVVVNRSDLAPFLEARGQGEEAVESAFATWEGIAALAEEYHRWTGEALPETGGKALFGIDSPANFIFSSHQQLGEEAVSVSGGTGTVHLDTKAFRKIWDCYYQPMIKGHFAAYGRFRSDDLKTGDILAFLGSSSSAAYLPDEVVESAGGEKHAIQVLMLPMPVFAGGERVAVQQGAGMAIIRSTPEEEYATAAFAAWFTDAERNIRFASESSYVPVTVRAVEQSAAGFTGDKTSLSPVDQALYTALEQVSGYRMYTAKPYDGAYQVRSILGGRLENFTADARQGVMDLMAGGASHEEAVEAHAGEDSFQAFLDSCQAALEAEGIAVTR